MPSYRSDSWLCWNNNRYRFDGCHVLKFLNLPSSLSFCVWYCGRCSHFGLWCSAFSHQEYRIVGDGVGSRLRCTSPFPLHFNQEQTCRQLCYPVILSGNSSMWEPGPIMKIFRGVIGINPKMAVILDPVILGLVWEIWAQQTASAAKSNSWNNSLLFGAVTPTDLSGASGFGTWSKPFWLQSLSLGFMVT